MYTSTVQTILLNAPPTTTGNIDLDTASTGRLTIWKHNLLLFMDATIEEKLMGVGLGNEAKHIIHKRDILYSSHNDYLSLLLTTGIIGVALYLLLLFFLLRDIVRSRIDCRFKYLFLSLLIAVGVMNALSNSYIHRFELSQLFWLFMGIFYVLRDNKLDSISPA